MRYKALVITAALLAAPLAFAEGPNSSSAGSPPSEQNQGDHHGPSLLNIVHAEMHIFDGDAHMGSSTEGRPVMHPQMMGSSTHDWNRPTTTPDGRPLPGSHNMGSTTNPGMGWGDTRGDGAREHMMASSTMGSTTASTTARGALPGFLKHIFSFFAATHDDASSTSVTPPPQHSDDGTTTASTTVEAGTQTRGPAMPIIQFLQHLFGFMH